MSHRAALQQWLDSGGRAIGQIIIEAVEPIKNCGYRLVHQEDAAAIEAGSLAWEALELFSTPEDARTVSLYDAETAFRPLKSAPNLRRGWRLELASLAELHLAIEFLYPAAIGLWVAEREGRLARIPLAETLGRQSGMYAVTRKATPEQVTSAIRSCCGTGCLRANLWVTPEEAKALPEKKGHASTAEGDEGELPLLCQEACNLLVGALRAEIKK